MKRGVFSSVLLLISLYVVPSAAAQNVRVIAAQAAIRLNADPNSLTVATVPAGTVLEVDRTQGAWFAVWLPPEREGASRRLGFLALSDAQLLEEKAPVPGRGQGQTPEETRSLPPPRRPSSSDLDGFAGVTFKLQGARAIVGTVDSGERSNLPTSGLSINKFFGQRRFAGIFADFSWIDAGSAFAQLGTARSDVKAWAIDFHGGYQYQYSGRRVRPYVQGGLGIFLQRTTGAITVGGTTVSSLDQTDRQLSVIFGGGARFMVGRDWGVRAGFDALSVRVSEGGYINYGRFVGGTFFSF